MPGAFLDHYGPDDVDETGAMVVAPHPHTGLQTVSWLFAGEIEHRDSAGHRGGGAPGAVNLMTAGRGISHSELSTSSGPQATALHGVQLWIALPDDARAVEADFEHHEAPRAEGRGWSATVLLGSLLGPHQPGAHLLTAGRRGDSCSRPAPPSPCPSTPTYEHGVLVDAGDVTVGGTPVGVAELGYLGPPAATPCTCARPRTPGSC